MQRVFVFIREKKMWSFILLADEGRKTLGIFPPNHECDVETISFAVDGSQESYSKLLSNVAGVAKKFQWKKKVVLIVALSSHACGPNRITFSSSFHRPSHCISASSISIPEFIHDLNSTINKPYYSPSKNSLLPQSQTENEQKHDCTFELIHFSGPLLLEFAEDAGWIQECDIGLTEAISGYWRKLSIPHIEAADESFFQQIFDHNNIFKGLEALSTNRAAITTQLTCYELFKHKHLNSSTSEQQGPKSNTVKQSSKKSTNGHKNQTSQRKRKIDLL